MIRWYKMESYLELREENYSIALPLPLSSLSFLIHILSYTLEPRRHLKIPIPSSSLKYLRVIIIANLLLSRYR